MPGQHPAPQEGGQPGGASLPFPMCGHGALDKHKIFYSSWAEPPYLLAIRVPDHCPTVS